MLIRLLCFSVGFSGLPGQLLGQRLAFLQSAVGEEREVRKFTLFIKSKNSSHCFKSIQLKLSEEPSEIMCQICVPLHNLYISVKVYEAWVRKEFNPFPNSQ